MTEPEFRRALVKICAYYERKFPERMTFELWFSKLSKYPDECLPWMVRNLCEKSDRFPPNLPNVMRSLWGDWLRDHPEKQEEYRAARECSDEWCDAGEIHAGIVSHGRYCVFSFCCAVCGQSRMAWPKASSGQLQAAGYCLDCHEETVARLAENMVIPIAPGSDTVDWKAIPKDWRN
jgi:hypothetical protein